MDIVCLDFRKALGAVSCKILTFKLMTYGLDEQTAKQIENRLNSQAQEVVISSTKLSWRPVTACIPQGLILGLILFNVFINSLDNGVDCTLKLVDDKITE